MKRIAKIMPLVVVILACTAGGSQMSEADVRDLVNSHLAPGDSEAKIVGFFTSNSLPYDFDRFQNRYQSNWPGSDVETGGVKSKIAIWIYVNEDGSFQRAVVEEVFTSY